MEVAGWIDISKVKFGYSSKLLVEQINVVAAWNIRIKILS